MKKRLFWAVLIYIISVGFVLGFMLSMINRWGFSYEIYLYTSFILLLFAGMFGYIFLSTLLAPKRKMDENLFQLTREILHELNIPLSTIQANTSLLKKKLEDEKSLKRLGRIEDSSKRLERLYKELVYSIKKELQPIEKEQFDLQSMIEERVDVFEAFERNRFIMELEPCSITADKIGFEKVLDNLLMNAMKYSEKNSPITLILKDKILQIADEGMGMSETELLKIYERYYQADSSKEGEGIGLALVKSYCDSENIEIQIKSKKGIGTTISLNFEKIQS
jgi:two-component system OmpR family sensor kinase